jgi:hypothetical protein
MVEDKDESSSFRVVDKRSFSADGTRREADREPEEESRQPAAPSPRAAPAGEPAEPSRRPAPAPAEPEAEAEEEFEVGAPGFDTLVSYLSTTAMFQMGLLAGPGGERIPPDLVNARRTIDLLEILQEKTEGNLTAEESKLLEDILYELRMSYVEMEKRVSPRGK